MLFVLPFLSALLLCLSFWLSGGGWLVFIAFLPLLFFIQQSHAKKISSKKIILFVWLAGLLFLLLELSWILQLKFNIDRPLSSTELRPILILNWLLMSLILSSGFWLFGLLITRRKNILASPRLSFIILPATWIVAEYGRSWLYMASQWAPDATVGPHWNFGALGYTAITTPLAPISRIFGLYGLGAAVVIINLIIFYAIQKKYRPLLWVAPAIISFTLIGRFIFSGSGDKSVEVQSVQLGKDQPVSDPATMNKIQAATRTHNPGLVVLPEYAFLYEDSINQTVDKIFSNQPLASPGLIIYSRNEYSTDKPAKRSTDIVYSYRNGRELFTQRKYFLIPAGEYLPVMTKLFLAVFNRSYLEPQYQATRYIKKGTKPESIYNGDIKIGALSCSGIVSPKFYRRLANQGAEVLINSASLQSFTDAPFYLKQARQMAIFHAVANAKPFIQASRTGRSYIIDPAGKVLAETNHGNAGILNANISLSKTRTPYTRFGDFIVILALGVLIWFFRFYKKPGKQKLAWRLESSGCQTLVNLRF